MRVALIVAVLVMLAAACGGGQAATFDPSAPCVADHQAPGAYPALEALLPTTFEGRPPARLDSGRNCSPANLGTLARHGIREVRFAGALWETGERSGFTMAVLVADERALTAERVAEFYETGARAGRKTEDVTRSTVDVAGREAFAIDTLNDESFQTIVVWDAPRRRAVHVLLVGSDIRETGSMAAHRDLVRKVLDAFG
ncbi:MAG TPA: hypothetical protein VH723_10060 [Candidatus Limnocylindrales bacterium]